MSEADDWFAVNNDMMDAFDDEYAELLSDQEYIKYLRETAYDYWYDDEDLDW